jgi:hypothetical protein
MKPEHEKKRPQHATKEHNSGQPRQVSATQRCFRRRNIEGSTSEVNDRQPDPGSKIQQTRQELRRYGSQEELRERR